MVLSERQSINSTSEHIKTWPLKEIHTSLPDGISHSGLLKSPRSIVYHQYPQPNILLNARNSTRGFRLRDIFAQPATSKSPYTTCV